MEFAPGTSLDCQHWLLYFYDSESAKSFFDDLHVRTDNYTSGFRSAVFYHEAECIDIWRFPVFKASFYLLAAQNKLYGGISVKETLSEFRYKGKVYSLQDPYAIPDDKDLGILVRKGELWEMAPSLVVAKEKEEKRDDLTVKKIHSSSLVTSVGAFKNPSKPIDKSNTQKLHDFFEIFLKEHSFSHNFKVDECYPNTMLDFSNDVSENEIQDIVSLIQKKLSINCSAHRFFKKSITIDGLLEKIMEKYPVLQNDAKSLISQSP